jgi:hypothetical protein
MAEAPSRFGRLEGSRLVDFCFKSRSCAADQGKWHKSSESSRTHTKQIACWISIVSCVAGLDGVSRLFPLTTLVDAIMMLNAPRESMVMRENLCTIRSMCLSSSNNTTIRPQYGHDHRSKSGCDDASATASTEKWRTLPSACETACERRGVKSLACESNPNGPSPGECRPHFTTSPQISAPLPEHTAEPA